MLPLLSVESEGTIASLRNSFANDIDSEIYQIMLGNNFNLDKLKRKLNKSRRRQTEQDFLVSVSVHQAKDIHLQHLKSLVEVSLGGKVKTTRVAKSSSNPHFNEYMVFEMRCTLSKLLKKSITFRLYHEACFRRCTGELIIDLETVWNADGRGFCGVWGRLVPCSGAIGRQLSESCGLLQFDLVILSENTKAPNQFDHQSSQVLELDRQRILFNFNLYRGTFPTISDYCVRVSLCGVGALSRTDRLTNTPEWNQQFQFMWFFPALCSNFEIKIESPGVIHSKVICKENISLRSLVHVVNGEHTVPTFGPAWWHFYKNDAYLGRILSQFKPHQLQNKLHLINDFWTSLVFKIHLGIVKLDFLHSSSKYVHLQMVCGEQSSSPFDLLCTSYANCDLYFLDLTHKIPTFSMDLLLPDLRHILRDEILLRDFSGQFQMNINSIDMKNISEKDLEHFLKDTENALESLGEVLSNMDDGETIMQWHVNFRASTVDFLAHLVDELRHFREDPRKFSYLETFLEDFLKKLQHISSQGVTKWPQLFINLFDDHWRLFGVHKIDLKDIVYLNESYGEAFLCRKRHTILFKDPQCCHEGKHCGCISGQGEIILRMGGEGEDKNIWPEGWVQSSLSHFNFIESPKRSNLKCTIFLYQAKIEHNLNRTSLNGTYLDIFFSGHHVKSTIQRHSLIPNWHEVITFENIQVECDVGSYVQNPPIILFKLYDGTKLQKDFLGIGYTFSRISLRTKSEFKRKWKWIPIMRNGVIVAQLLLHTELEEVSEENGHEGVKITAPFPKEIDIPTKKFHILFVCFGLRLMGKGEMKNSELLLEFANLTLSMGSSCRFLGRTCSFTNFLQIGEVELPENLSYWPPIIIKHRREKSSKIIGLTIISNSKQFHEETPPLTARKEIAGKLINTHEVKEPSIIANGEKIEGGGFDIAKNFINSAMTIELENQPEFENFRDWADVLEMIRTRKRYSENTKKRKYCILRGHIGIFKEIDALNEKIDKYQQVANHSQELSIVVRVYVVRGINLRSRDLFRCIHYNGVGEGANFRSRQFCQESSKSHIWTMSRAQRNIPQDHILKISLKDRDLTEYTDDLIGETLIDLEDRLMTKHKAFLAVAEEYNMFGYNMWRYPKTPLETLLDLCEEHNLPEPIFTEESLWIGDREFKDLTKLSLSENFHQRLAISALRQFNELIEGIHLIPEHVETRSLFRSDRPGIEQGKLQLWVEIFNSNNVPPAIDISPEHPQRYELRVIVLNTAEVAMKDTTILGIKMSDIYVKMIVTTKKRRFYEKYDTTVKGPLILNVQIWDNDTLSADDFIGATAINLNHLPVPASLAQNCFLAFNSNTADFIDLFGRKSIRGWFPVGGSYGKKELTGKVELDLEILTEAEARMRPVGKQRKAPEPLKDPSRPEISFQWYKAPWKTLRYIILPTISGKCPTQWLCIGGFLLLMLIVALLL
uniref:Putative membrane-associated protein fer-1 n=1 Tax=Lutzomyia longipalpis TaxID=7200 RepID=A0A1B0CK25_LUTLO